MDLAERLADAERAHRELRAAAPSRANRAEKDELYRVVKDALDAAGAVVADPDARAAIWRLTIDAEYHAGLGEADGYTDPAEAWEAYALLRRAAGS